MKFILEEQERKIFKKPQGKLFKSVQDMPLSNSKPIITIGDSSTKQLMDYWTKPILSVIDYKTKRQDIATDLEPTVTVENPAGHITEELWHAIRDTKSGIIVVDGEEDLAVIPAVLLSEPGTQVIYGQPDEGLVLIEVNEESQSKFGEILLNWQIRQGKDFLEKIQPDSSVLIVHHTDADGCCSGAIIHKYLSKKGVKKISTAAPGFSPRIDGKIKEGISQDLPDYLIVVDLGCESSKYLSQLSEKIPVLIVDHHRVHDQTFGNAVLVNPCNLDIPTSFNPSSVYFCHLITNNYDWLTVLGTYGDKGESKIQELSKQVMKKYNLNKQQILKAAHLIDSAEEIKSGYAQKAIKALIDSKTPQDFLGNPELNEFAQEIQSELDSALSTHEQDATIDKSLNLLILPIKTKYNIKSDIANFLQEKYPDKLILIYEERGDKIRISLRTLMEADFPELIRKSLKNIQGAGGGHSKAAGVSIPLEFFDEFLENFKKELKEEK